MNSVNSHVLLFKTAMHPCIVFNISICLNECIQLKTMTVSQIGRFNPWLNLIDKNSCFLLDMSGIFETTGYQGECPEA